MVQAMLEKDRAALTSRRPEQMVEQPSVCNELRAEGEPYSRTNNKPVTLEAAAVVLVTTALLGGCFWLGSARTVMFCVPFAFIAVPVAATQITGRKFARLMPADIKSFLGQTAFVVIISAAILPLAAGGICVYSRMGMVLPLQASTQSGGVVSLLIFQLLYAVIPEEIFFRGYLQGVIRRTACLMQNSFVGTCIALGANAMIFASVHVAVSGDLAAAWTFLPSLVFGGLYLRTGSLYAPILMHLICNCFYIAVCG